jgi:hypothetical protein
MLQSPLLSRIGGSTRVREELTAALASGRGVTARIRWLSARSRIGDGEGAPRWVHCTPLLGAKGTVGVWMIVLVDEEGYEPATKFRIAPPVAQNIPRAAERQALLRSASAAGNFTSNLSKAGLSSPIRIKDIGRSDSGGI